MFSLAGNISYRGYDITKQLFVTKICKVNCRWQSIFSIVAVMANGGLGTCPQERGFTFSFTGASIALRLGYFIPGGSIGSKKDFTGNLNNTATEKCYGFDFCLQM